MAETSTLSVGKRAATEGGEREESGTETLNAGPEAENVRDWPAVGFVCFTRRRGGRYDERLFWLSLV